MSNGRLLSEEALCIVLHVDIFLWEPQPAPPGKIAGRHRSHRPQLHGRAFLGARSFRPTICVPSDGRVSRGLASDGEARVDHEAEVAVGQRDDDLRRAAVILRHERHFPDR